MNRRRIQESDRHIDAAFWHIILWNVQTSLSHPEASSASLIPARPPPCRVLAAAANLTRPARMNSDRARIFPFSDCGHTFSSQSGIGKGNYTSHWDELLPKKEVKTPGCRRKYRLLRHSSRSTHLALPSFSTALVCVRSEVTENL